MVKIYKENETIYMEDGDEIVELNEYITVDKKSGKEVIKLPENSANRQWIMVDKVTEEGIELNYKETRTIGARGSSKKLQDYMTDEEKQIVADIMAKCQERKNADKPTPMTAEEKLRAKIAKLQAQIDALNKEEVDE